MCCVTLCTSLAEDQTTSVETSFDTSQLLTETPIEILIARCAIANVAVVQLDATTAAIEVEYLLTYTYTALVNGVLQDFIRSFTTTQTLTVLAPSGQTLSQPLVVVPAFSCRLLPLSFTPVDSGGLQDFRIFLSGTVEYVTCSPALVSVVAC